MNKKLSMVILACVMAASFSSVVSADSETTMTIPRVPDGSITIDGVMDEIYTKCENQLVEEYDFVNFSANPCSVTGNFYACYDSNYFYFFVDALDEFDIDYTNEDLSNPALRDCLGLMLDFDYNRSDKYAYSYADNQDRVGYINLGGDGVYATYHIYANDLPANDKYSDLHDKIQFSTIPELNGEHIIYELALPIPADQDLSVGNKIGLGVLLNDAEFSLRVGQTLWAPESGDMWRWSDTCGTAVLGELVEVAVTETEAPVTETEATVEETVAETEETVEETEAPVVETEETVEDVVETEAPQTFDAGVVAAAVAAVSAAGFAVAKKKNN